MIPFYSNFSLQINKLMKMMHQTKIELYSDVYSESYQTSKMERFAEMVNDRRK